MPLNVIWIISAASTDIIIACISVNESVIHTILLLLKLTAPKKTLGFLSCLIQVK